MNEFGRGDRVVPGNDTRRTERTYGAVVISDVAGFSDSVARVEEPVIHRVLDDLALFAEVAEEHGGRVVTHRGDGLKLFFESPVRALEASLAFQTAVIRRNEGAEGQALIRHRIGIHLGDVVTIGELVTGQAVAVAARLEQSCPPGRVCYSNQVYEAVRQSVQHAWEFKGPVQVKGVPQAVKIYVGRSDLDVGPDEPVTLTRPQDSMHERGVGVAVEAKEETATRVVLIVLAVLVIGLSAFFAGQEMVRHQSEERGRLQNSGQEVGG